ncbi:MAG: hypothetical protein AAFR47_00570 [Pseudomonadota bacterium]
MQADRFILENQGSDVHQARTAYDEFRYVAVRRLYDEVDAPADAFASPHSDGHQAAGLRSDGELVQAVSDQSDDPTSTLRSILSEDLGDHFLW